MDARHLVVDQTFRKSTEDGDGSMKPNFTPSFPSLAHDHVGGRDGAIPVAPRGFPFDSWSTGVGVVDAKMVTRRARVSRVGCSVADTAVRHRALLLLLQRADVARSADQMTRRFHGISSSATSAFISPISRRWLSMIPSASLRTRNITTVDGVAASRQGLMAGQHGMGHREGQRRTVDIA